MADDGSAGTGFEEEEEIENPLGQYEGGRNARQQRHGTGRALHANGDYYEGCYSKNLRYGKGLYVFDKRNGARYDGEYRFGLRSGMGTFYYPDGSRYEGEWKKNTQHGCGIYYYINGDTYSGAWFKGKRHGIGTYTYATLGVKLTCAWDADEITGGGRLEYPMSGVSFHGFFENNRPLGKGVFVFPRLNCMQLGIYSSPPRDLEAEEIQAETSGEGDEEKPRQEGPPSQWFAKDVVEYDESLMPPLPKTRILPDSPDIESVQSAILLSENSEQEEGAWSEGREELGEEEDLVSSAGELHIGDQIEVMSSPSMHENMNAPPN
ncbi:hypothetical protein M8J76_004254 [Diaphorina citri]|nr:hypothetical protein M8J75_016316 [Diaphorina citri]KAI5744666.1 hypothetical protein M8J76_004254 [Diaphorina citri]KAI5751678.1 hypothetical protein M8J77_009833 [Diaphorina citri]